MKQIRSVPKKYSADVCVTSAFGNAANEGTRDGVSGKLSSYR